jgi:hypothetical protein
MAMNTPRRRLIATASASSDNQGDSQTRPTMALNADLAGGKSGFTGSGAHPVS